MSKMLPQSRSLLIPIETVSNQIYLIRGQKVMIGQHLCEFYHVPVKALIQAVKRNKDRFPSYFMFQLNKEGFENLKSQIVTSSWGGRIEFTSSYPTSLS